MEPELLAQIMGGGQGGPPPMEAGPPQGGDAESVEGLIRHMIQIGRKVIDHPEIDDQDMAVVESVNTMMQKLLAGRASADEKAMGVTPQMKSMQRAYAGAV